ncbi:amino acid ABC transporter substrate-binding protein [Marivibrio halodurans]|uniref:Amino acid ABC transporter substrate-binding protein n=1 Tax=Marivibrio halodurans TaxID=2039722 RepID=A0A8J7RWM5_9PROT|nr:amino acid ABC transporter substrate-binding protein [Marivibrio halodurans]MBP5855860.1 amino acid ABC transporter substrate-binding protein [Marivibrio halodurans]
MKLKTLMAAGAALAFGATVANAATLDDVKAKGYLDCGVTTGLAGFASPDDEGNWTGFDVDFCRAMSAAIFGDPDKVKYTPTTGKTRFTALQSGEVDVLARNTTWTLSRDVDLGFEFIGVNYYDGQGFMIRKDMGITSATQLDGASVCIQSGTTTELNLADYFRTNNMSFTPVVVEDSAEARQNYDQGACDVYTTDRSGLAAQRAVLQEPDTHMLLPEIISKEPLGPLVRHGDNQWGDIARWTLNALVTAEEFGVTSENADSMLESENPEIRRLLGSEGNLGGMLGLEADWALNAIKTVGNYGEIFEAHIGPNTPVGLDRGLNALYKDGGILYSPPFR